MSVEFRIVSAVLMCAGLWSGAASAQFDDEEGTIAPKAAEMMPLAVQSLTLDVARSRAGLIGVGERGHILHSADGERWEQLPSPVRSSLAAVHFPTPEQGWIVGDDSTILHSSDGGLSWDIQMFAPELETPLLDVLFLDTQRGIAMGGYGLAYVTDDGGETWTELEAPEVVEEALHFNALARLGNGDVFMVGESGMMGVSPDGLNWERLESPYMGSLFGTVPFGETGAIVFGLRGNAYMSSDVRAGEWREIDLRTLASFFGGTELPDGRFAIVGMAGAVRVIDPVQGTVERVMSNVSTSQSSALTFADKLIIVGESGPRVLPLP